MPETDAGGRTARREQTRAALLAAARRLWAERGIHGASLDDIAAAAGLTKGAVYSNFSGKTDLLLALLERCTREVSRTDVHEELADGTRPPEDRCAAAGRIQARRASGDQARLTGQLLVEFWLYGMRDYAAGWRLADWCADHRAQLAGTLKETGGLPPHERATLAAALDIGLSLQHLLDPERVPADLYAKGLRLVLADALP